MLDPAQQRILGVLIEKELAVPDSYPLTENNVMLGCNQKSNRDPQMELEDEEISSALRTLVEEGYALRVTQAGSRTIRFKHLLEDKLGLNGREKAVMAELLLRGPQAPGALKPRVARMGMMASPDEIATVLEGLRMRSPGPLVEQLPRQARERDQRWAHRLGERPVAAMTPDDSAVMDSAPVTPPVASAPPAQPSGLEERVAQLESQVADLRQIVERLRDELRN